MFLNLLSSYVGTQEVPDGEGGTKTQYIYDDVWTSYAKDGLGNVLLWLVIAFAVVLLAVGIFIRVKRADFFRTYVKYAVAFATGLAVVILVVMLALEFFDMSESGAVFELVLIPSAVLFGVIVLGTAATYVCSLYSKKAFKISLWTTLGVFAAAVIALIVCISVYYSSGQAADNNWADASLINDLGLYLAMAGLIIALALLTFFFGRKDKKGFDSRTISYAAVCIAMSFALSYLKLWEMPYGGSVTIASLLPLMIYSYMFGVRKGVFAGAIYGLLQVIQDPWILHPAQLLLDYPIAFAGIGLAGMFRSVRALDKTPQVKFLLGALIGSAIRYLSHLFSGVFAFGQFAADYGFESDWLYSLTYNTFVFADIAIVIVVGVVVFSSKAFMNVVDRYNRPVKPAAAQAVPAAPVQNAEGNGLPPQDMVSKTDVNAPAESKQTPKQE